MTERSSNPPSDAELAERARDGDNEAFAELWRRHAQAGRAIARSVAASLDPDDLVAEAYGKIYALVKRGRGPTGAFRPYLAATIRNIAINVGRSQRESAIDFADQLIDETTSDDAHMRKLDRDLTTEAFRALPERWQQALWYSEVEDMSVKECARIFGIKPTAMAMLTFRAREGLRDAWIQAHIADAEPGTDHEWTIERLGAHTRERLTKLETARLELHLDECESCTNIADEARDVASRLASCLLPPLLGAAGAAAYLGEIGGGTPTGAAMGATSTATAGMHVFTSGGVVQTTLHQLQAVVGSSAAITLAIASGLTIADIPAHRAAEQAGGQPGAGMTSPGPTQLEHPTLTVEADLGPHQTFFPILTGTAFRDSIVRIAMPDRTTSDIHVGDDGRWRSEQLETSSEGPLTIENLVGGTVVARSSVDIRLHTPALMAESSDNGLALTVSGIPEASIAVLTEFQDVPLPIAAAVLSATGNWSATYSLPLPFDIANLVGRYAAGKRFGPSLPVDDRTRTTPPIPGSAPIPAAER